MKFIDRLPRKLFLFLGAFLLTGTFILQAEDERARTIVFFGDSLTSGYGLDPDEAYPARVQEKIDSKGLNYRVVNAGLTGETSAGGLRRINWTLRQPVDVFVLELGGNDGLRGLPPKETEKNLQGIIDRVEERYPEARIVIAGMQAPPNMGKDFGEEFAALFPRLAETNDATLIPFLLENVGGVPELNLPDGVHPSARGQRIVAQNVWEILEPLLEKPNSNEPPR